MPDGKRHAGTASTRPSGSGMPDTVRFASSAALALTEAVPGEEMRSPQGRQNRAISHGHGDRRLNNLSASSPPVVQWRRTSSLAPSGVC